MDPDEDLVLLRDLRGRERRNVILGRFTVCRERDRTHGSGDVGDHSYESPERPVLSLLDLACTQVFHCSPSTSRPLYTYLHTCIHTYIYMNLYMKILYWHI